MNNLQKQIDKLWEQFRVAIDLAYSKNSGQSGDASWNTNALRDYTQNGWHDDLKRLLEREVENEREHRRGHLSPKGFSAYTACKLLLMRNAAEGSKREEMIPASHFLVYRKTAMEAEVLGFILKGYLTPEWLEQVSELDYAKLMGSK